MQLGPLFSQVMGIFSEESLRRTHQQYTQRYIDGNYDDDFVACINLLTLTMGHPCRHVLLGRTEPLTADDFDEHRHLFLPNLLVKAANILLNIEDALIGLRNQYANSENHNERVFSIILFMLHHLLCRNQYEFKHVIDHLALPSDIFKTLNTSRMRRMVLHDEDVVIVIKSDKSLELVQFMVTLLQPGETES